MTCAICAFGFKTSDKAEVLACHPRHLFHQECYIKFVKSWEAKGWKLLCPICRTPIDKSKVVKKQLQIKQKAETNEEIFALDKG